jgi:hypothetical protein
MVSLHELDYRKRFISYLLFVWFFSFLEKPTTIYFEDPRVYPVLPKRGVEVTAEEIESMNAVLI